MPSEPLRLKILKNFTAALKTITPANGYTHDLSESVYRGRLIFGENDPLPMVSILEMPVPVDPAEGPPGAYAARVEWDLLLQGWVEDDRENPTDPAHYLMAEVKKKVAEEARKCGQMDPNALGLGVKVEKIIIGQGVVRPADETQDAAYFWLRVTLKIVEDNLDPYV